MSAESSMTAVAVVRALLNEDTEGLAGLRARRLRLEADMRLRLSLIHI